MRTRKRQWAVLLVLPLLIGLLMWPVSVRRRKGLATQEATRALWAEIGKWQGDIRPAVVRQLIAEGADVNAPAPDPNNSGSTTLMRAVEHMNPQVVRLLLDHGARVNVPWGAGFDHIGHANALTKAREVLQEIREAHPTQTPATALLVRKQNRIIAMLKAAGAHE